MSSILKRVLDRMICFYTDRLDDEQFVKYIIWLTSRKIESEIPKNALKMLLSLDNLLYGLQGQVAIQYEGGIHTKHRHMKYHEFFKNRIREFDDVIDIGCGIGAVAFDVSNVAKRVVGIDIDEKIIAVAQRKFQRQNLVFHVGDVLQYLPDETFNVAILSNVLEHLTGRSDFLRRVKELLKPDRFLIRVPLFERDWRVPLKKELGVEWRLDVTHEIEYTLESFVEEMAKAGLKIDHLEVRWGEIWAELSTIGV